MKPQRGIVTHNVVPMRAEPNGGSEQVSQAILGDSVIWLEERDEYVRVQTADAYEGWIWRRHLRPCCQDRANWPFDAHPKRAYFVIGNMTDLHSLPGELQPRITKLVHGTWVRKVKKVRTYHGHDLEVLVPFGSGGKSGRKLVRGYVDAWDLQKAKVKGYSLTLFDEYWVCTIAQRFIGTPYLWGGTTSFGFDCSGFVQRIYSMFDIILPRDAYLQAQSPLGRMVPEGKRLHPGDLVFFCGQQDPRNRGITHVGIALDAKQFIHAVGKEGVIVTAFDDPYYSSRYTYRGAWRYASRKGEGKNNEA